MLKNRNSRRNCKKNQQKTKQKTNKQTKKQQKNPDKLNLNLIIKMFPDTLICQHQQTVTRINPWNTEKRSFSPSVKMLIQNNN